MITPKAIKKADLKPLEMLFCKRAKNTGPKAKHMGTPTAAPRIKAIK